jgi:hypothetical protein
MPALNGAKSMSLAKVKPPHDTRRLDWWLAAFAIVWGLNLLLPGSSMNSPAYSHLLRWAPENIWGIMTFLAGTAHVVALIVNGGRGWTPYMRAFINYLAVVIYSTIAVGFYAENAITTAVPAYFMIAIGHTFCAVAAVRDASTVFFWKREIQMMEKETLNA